MTITLSCGDGRRGQVVADAHPDDQIVKQIEASGDAEGATRASAEGSVVGSECVLCVPETRRSRSALARLESDLCLFVN